MSYVPVIAKQTEREVLDYILGEPELLEVFALRKATRRQIEAEAERRLKVLKKWRSTARKEH
jgi:hypothetical protein